MNSFLNSDEHSILDAIQNQSGVDIKDLHKPHSVRDSFKKLWDDGFGKVVLISFVLTLIISSFFGVKSFTDSDNWNPLGVYPNQTVLNQTEVIKDSTYDGQTIAGYPVVYLNEFVSVIGSKENLTKVPLRIQGERTWVSVLPPGGIVAKAKGSNTLQPGVNQFSFKNEVPQEVIDYVNRIGKATIWHLHGEECPTRMVGQKVRKNKDGKDELYGGRMEIGVCRTWDSANFVLVPTARPSEK